MCGTIYLSIYISSHSPLLLLPLSIPPSRRLLVVLYCATCGGNFMNEKCVYTSYTPRLVHIQDTKTNKHRSLVPVSQSVHTCSTTNRRTTITTATAAVACWSSPSSTLLYPLDPFHLLISTHPDATKLHSPPSSQQYTLAVHSITFIVRKVQCCL